MRGRIRGEEVCCLEARENEQVGEDTMNIVADGGVGQEVGGEAMQS